MGGLSTPPRILVYKCIPDLCQDESLQGSLWMEVYNTDYLGYSGGSTHVRDNITKGIGKVSYQSSTKP